MKDIKVRASYLGLGQEITKCQTEETKSDCLTRKLKDRVLRECGCAPFSMKSYYGAEVLFVAKTELCIMMLQTPVCNSSQLDCVVGVRKYEPSCLDQCEGLSLHVDRLYTSQKNQEGTALFSQEYEKYKNPDMANLTYPTSMKGKNMTFKFRNYDVVFSFLRC